MPALPRPLSSLHDEDEDPSSFSRWIGYPGAGGQEEEPLLAVELEPELGGQQESELRAVVVVEVKSRRDKVPRATANCRRRSMALLILGQANLLCWASRRTRPPYHLTVLKVVLPQLI
jgi:hypothetical protein